MAISTELLLEWIDHVSNVDGLMMDPAALADDVILMALVFPTEESFVLAMNNVLRASEQLAAGLVDASRLERSYRGWQSYHFQSRRMQGRRADLRIVFQIPAPHTIQVKGFGHRHLPSDIYRRLRPR